MSRRTPFLPLMLFELGLASAEVMARRWSLMAAGACSPAEYWRMVAEKTAAGLATSAKVASRRKPAATALLAPWHKAATTNAQRLRK